MNLKIELARPLPSGALDHFRSLMAYCDPRIRSIDLSEAGIGSVLLEVDAAAGDLEAITGKVLRVAQRVEAGGAVPASEIHRRVSRREQRWTADLEAQLDRSRATLRLGDGIYGLTGVAALLSRVFDEDFRTLALRLGARDAQFPSLLGIPFLRRIKYFRSFPQYTTFASHLHPDIEKIDRFMADVELPQETVEKGAAGLATPEMVMSPTVCYHLYSSLQDLELDRDCLRVTALGRCCRWEAGNMRHLRRLWEFSMRELIWVGNSEAVAAEREKAIEGTLAYCEEMELEAWVENANDPFFSTDGAKKSYYQRGFAMKLELRLPYAPGGESVAASSFNNMGRTFGDACRIRLPGGAPASSGCAGWGLDRWVYAFLAQHGVDPDRWPERMRARAAPLLPQLQP
jgi:seryl-tRNA synthetase